MAKIFQPIAFALTLAALSVNVQAMPAQSARLATPAGSDQIALVANGCGPAFHLGLNGVCRPNAERVIVERPVVVARPVVVERRVVVERPVVVARPVVVRQVVRQTCGIHVGPIGVRTAC